MTPPIFIIHGIDGHPGENWFPWLRQELEKQKCRVIVPHFPSQPELSLQQWKEVISQHQKQLQQHPIFVGHSLGVPFILKLLEHQTASAAFLVAGFMGKVGNSYDPRMKSIAQSTFDWEKIKAHCPHRRMYHSDSDSLVSLEKAQELATHLQVPLTVIPRAGHFNQASGYTTFPQLKEDILDFLRR